MDDPKEVTTQISFRVSSKERRGLDLAAEISERSLSDFIRAAVIPAVEDTLVTHAIEAASARDGA